MQIENIQKRIDKIKSDLQLIGDMRPGSVSEQYTKCGRDGCCCQDPEKPKLHGPYNHLRYVHRGKSTTQFIQKLQLGSIKRELATYKKFRLLTEEWVNLALDLSLEKLRIEKEIIRKK